MRLEVFAEGPGPLARCFRTTFWVSRAGGRSRVRLKIECPRRSLRSGVTGFRKEVLVKWLRICVKLTGKSAAQYERLLELEENEEVEKMEITFMEKAEERGFKRGEAQAVEKLRQAVLQGVECRFGTVPKQVRRRLESTKSVERLATLFEKLMSASTADDLVALSRISSAPSP